MKRLPLNIRQNFSTMYKQGMQYHQCDTCGTQFPHEEQSSPAMTLHLAAHAQHSESKTYYVVVEGQTYQVQAANQKHAQVVAQGQYQQAQAANRPHRRTWRDRFPQKE